MYKYFILFVLSIAIIAGCSTEAKESQTEKATLVKLTPVQHKTATMPIYASGKVAAKNEAVLSFKTGGIIEKFYADEGDLVSQGRNLATLDMDEVNAYLQQAESGYNKAKRDFDRVINLYADSVASLEQKQNVETALKVAEANLEIARFNARHSSINAPFTGRILKRFSNMGELVSAGMPVLSISSANRNWIVRVEVSDRDITRIQMNDKANVIFDAYPQDTFSAYVSEKGAGASPVSGLFEVELTLDNSDRQLYSGFIANVEIQPGDKKDLAFLPVKALNSASAKTGFVFIPNEENNGAVKKQISVAYVMDDSIAVEQGLEKIDYVISEGMEYLVDGSAILIQ